MISIMEDKIVFIKNNEEIQRTERPGRLYRLMAKSENLEAIISELEIHAQSRWFKHSGEEIHLVLHGELEYTVGKKSYRLSKGDMLWHPSSLKHRAKNVGDEKVSYITIGTPPSVAWDEL